MFSKLPLPLTMTCVLNREGWVIDARLQEVVDSLWKDELKSGKELFDGEVFFLNRIGDSLEGSFLSYRYVLAVGLRPELREQFPGKPLGINGITRLEEQVLFAKRSQKMALYGGLWELAPSGTVDPLSQLNGKVDLVHTITNEFREELGLNPSIIRRIHPIGFYLDQEAGTYELCLELRLNAKPEIRLSSEYSEYRWVHREELSDLTRPGDCVPLSAFLVRTGF